MLIYFDLDISQGYGIRKSEIRLFTCDNPVCLTRVSKKLNIEKPVTFGPDFTLIWLCHSFFFDPVHISGYRLMATWDWTPGFSGTEEWRIQGPF